MRENLYAALAGLGSDIVGLKVSIESAAKAADESNKRAESLTKQLVGTQKAYTWLTGALVLATIASVVIAALKP